MKTSTRPYYAAIDLHSNNLFIAVVNAQGKRIQHCRLFCEIHEVEKFLQPYRGKIHSIAVESTFNWYWLVDGLEDLGYRVALANPAAIVQYDGIKQANDKTDAFFLAELLRLGILPTGYTGDREWRAARDLMRRRASLVAKRTSFILSLRNLQMRTLGSCDVPTNQIKNGKPEILTGLFGDPCEQMVSGIQKSHIDALSGSIAQMERYLMKETGGMPGLKQLTRIPGIGRILSLTILLETGDIRRFASGEKYASYCRMVKASQSSNGKTKGANNSKCGNRYLAWAFIEAANFVRRFDSNAQRWHDRKAAKTSNVLAKKALGCKLAKAVWHMLSKGSDYDSERLFGCGKNIQAPPKPVSKIPEELLSATKRG